MTTVKIYLIGLIAIWSTDEATTIVVRDLPRSDTIDEVCVEPHIPELWWDARCEDEVGGAACDSSLTRTFVRCGDGDETRGEFEETWKETGDMWLLNGEELTLSGSFSPLGERPEPRRIAQMSQLVDRADSGRFDEMLLSQPMSNGIVAHWRLEGVFAEACHLVRLPQGVGLVRFERGGSPRRFHPVADVALVQFKVRDDHLTLTGTKSNSSARKVDLYPEDGKPITLVLSNQPPGWKQRSLTGLHFDYFYEFSKRPPTRRKRRRVPQARGIEGRFQEYVYACAQGSPDPILKDIVDGCTKAERQGNAMTSLGNRPMCPLAEFGDP